MFRIAVFIYLILGAVGGLLSIVRGVYCWAEPSPETAALNAKLAKLFIARGMLELPIFCGLTWWFVNNEAWAEQHWFLLMWCTVPLAIPVVAYKYWERRLIRAHELTRPPE